MIGYSCANIFLIRFSGTQRLRNGGTLREWRDLLQSHQQGPHLHLPSHLDWGYLRCPSLYYSHFHYYNHLNSKHDHHDNAQ